MYLSPCLIIILFVFGYLLIGKNYRNKIKTVIYQNQRIILILSVIGAVWYFMSGNPNIIEENKDSKEEGKCGN